MAERTEVRFSEAESDWDVGASSGYRKELAETYLDKVLTEVANNAGSLMPGYDTVAKLRAVSNTDNNTIGLYNQIWSKYHEIIGDGTKRAGTHRVPWPVMDFDTLKSNFGDGSSSIGMDAYVSHQAIKISGEVFAILAGASAAAPGATHDPDLTEAKKQQEAYIKAHADAAAGATSAPRPPRTNTSDVAIADFKEQCFLLAHIFKFYDYKTNNVELVERKGLPYYGAKKDEENTNKCLMVHGEPYGFMNKLTQYSTQSTLLNLQTHEISALVPKIRLFKVFENDEGDEISQEIHFDSHPNHNDIGFAMLDRQKRGVGVGINDFTFSYEGSDPFAVKKSIKASLTLYAASFDELFRSRSRVLDPGDWRYVDLALKTGGANIQQQLDATKGTVEYENLSRLNFRIKAVVGWQSPPTRTGGSNSDLSKAVYNSFVTLNLTPTIHNFDIQDDGSVRFKIQYLAYIESHFDNPLFSIFGNEDTFGRYLKRKLVISSLSEACKPESIAPIKEKWKDEIRDDLREDAAEIITQLMGKKRLRYVNISFSKLRSLNMDGPYSAFGKEFSKASTTPTKDTIAAVEKALAGGADPRGGKLDRVLNVGAFSTRPVAPRHKKYNLSFFYVSDLFDTILESIDRRLASADRILNEIVQGAAKDPIAKLIDSNLLAKEKKEIAKQLKAFKKLRVLLGPLEIVNQQDPTDSRFINMGDIPISVKYFIEWLSKKTLNKATVIYPLPRFINQFFKEFIATFLNNDTCFEGRVKQRTLLTQAAITSYKRKEEDPSDIITQYIGALRAAVGTTYISRFPLDNLGLIAPNSADPWPLLNISGVSHEPVSDAGAENEINYLTFFAGRANPVEKQNGNFEEDKKGGIHHYSIGKDRGIVKNIRMTRTDVPYLKEIRFAQEGYDGLEQLREVYDVSIDCYANVNVFPGTYIYVDPRGWSPQTERISKEIIGARDKARAAGTASVELAGFTALLEQDLTRYGIGGYYMVKRAESSFGPGKANTVIQAQWTHQAGTDSTSKSQEKVGKRPESAKCQVETKGSLAPQPQGQEPPIPTSKRQGEKARWWTQVVANMAPGSDDWQKRIRPAISELSEGGKP